MDASGHAIDVRPTFPANRSFHFLFVTHPI